MLKKISLFKIKEDVTNFDDFLKDCVCKNMQLTRLNTDSLQVEGKSSFKCYGGTSKAEDQIPYLQLINSNLTSEDKYSFRSRNFFPSAIIALKINYTLDAESKERFFVLCFGLAAESSIIKEKVEGFQL